MQKLKKNLPLVAIIGILFATGVVFANMFTAQNVHSRLGTSVVLGEDDENDVDEADEREDGDDNDGYKDEEDKNIGDEDKNDDKNEIDEDEQEEDQVKNGDKLGIREADEEDEDKNEIEDSKELDEDIGELSYDIRKVELKISVLAANGFAVGSFNDSLAEVKDMFVQAQAQVSSDPKGAENTFEAAKDKLERLGELVKISLKDDDEDEESVEEATEEIQELERDINKLENQLNIASTNGVDVSVYRSMLLDAETMLSQAKEKLSAGLYIEAEALAELADKKLNKIDDIIDDLFEDDDEEDDTAEEYKNEVALFVHNLKTLGEIEGGIGQQVRVVAQAQNDSKDEVENSIKEVEERGDVAEFFIGPKYGSINEIKAAIAENQNRIKVLGDLVNQTTDPAVKQVLQDQITMLAQQNTKLQKFVAENESVVSIFGWLFRLFA